MDRLKRPLRLIQTAAVTGSLLFFSALTVQGQTPTEIAPTPPAVSQAPIWPPALAGANEDGVLTLTGPQLLQVPEAVKQAAVKLGFKFEMATTPPTVELVFHNQLIDQAIGPDNTTGWSAWGEICIARDGSVYVAIGDHGPDGTRLKPGQHADAHVYLHRWLPDEHKLLQVARPNEIVQAGPEDPHWSKIHARIFETKQGKIVFIPTFNDGQRAIDAKWTSRVPTGQVFEYDPQTQQCRVIALLPPSSATATTQYDPGRNILYINLEGQFKNALYALDLNTREPVFQSPPGLIALNRNMAMDAQGQLYFNTPQGTLGRYHPDTQTIETAAITLPTGQSMRASSAQSADGWIYAVLTVLKQSDAANLVRFHPETGRFEPLGHDFLNIGSKGEITKGNYTTTMALSPDGKYVYYLPGAHGGAVRIGTPVVQYNIATGRTRVIAFLKAAMEAQAGYVPGGTYGIALSPDGATLYVNFNGHAIEKSRLDRMKPSGFGLTAFAAIHIPASERP